MSLRSASAHDYIVDLYRDAGRLAELPPAPTLAAMGFHDLGWYEFLYLSVIVVPRTFRVVRRCRPIPTACDDVFGGSLLLTQHVS